MRILILANIDIGLYRFRKELIEELLDNNEVYISLPEGELVQALEKIGCVFINTPVDRRGINPKKDLQLLRNYKKVMKEVKPDLVITYTIKPNIYGGIAAQRSRVEYVTNITGLGTAFEKRGCIRSLVVTLYKYALKNARVIFVENAEIKQILGSLHLCDKNKVVTLNGAGVNVEEFSYQDYPNNDVLKFLFVGRVMKEKGIEELLVAMERLIKDGEKCFLDIVGPLEENYKARIEQCEKSGWLKYHGYQDDVKPYIRECDCFVLPSYHEGMANTNLESASTGRPIITSDISGCKEAVINNVSGFLVKVRNADDLYHKMKDVTMLPIEKRKEMGIAGREHMVSCFEKQKIVSRTIDALFK